MLEFRYQKVRALYGIYAVEYSRMFSNKINGASSSKERVERTKVLPDITRLCGNGAYFR